ncbi:MAG: SRPBCC domain-containing protein, partial [Actinomycetota bacterium]|nr:SRPBCC domain-containing protein [Actinomycetota bacterium]
LATGAGRELGRITAWDPGRRLAFADNEGTEVDVSFEPCGAGTCVTLTHRGLDRLAPERAGELRRSGWTALAPFYREHLAPNVRPVAVAVVFQALLVLAIVFALGLAVTLAGGLPSWAVASLTAALLIAVGFAVLRTQDRLVQRWLPSAWHYRRISHRLFALLCLALLVEGLYRIFEHGEDVLRAVGLPVVLLLACWSWEEQGPARGRSLRDGAGSAGNAFARRHATAEKFLVILGLAALAGGLLSLARSVDALERVLSPAILALWGALSLYVVVSKRREKRIFCFNPTSTSQSPGR